MAQSAKAWLNELTNLYTPTSTQFDAAATARALVAAHTGLMVLAKDAPSAAETKATMTQLLRLLDSAP